jgi:hypothetical protein
MPEQSRRELRLRIARLRRRIDRHVRVAGDRGRELLQWRTYVHRYPAVAALAAFGTGLTLTTAWNRAGLGRRVGMRLVRQAGGWIGARLWEEFRQFWAAAPQPVSTATTTESDHVPT